MFIYLVTLVKKSGLTDGMVRDHTAIVRWLDLLFTALFLAFLLLVASVIFIGICFKL